ncbi:MAG: PIG-L deacetylase family protein [Candidatus Glassbacteria bacterium]
MKVLVIAPHPDDETLGCGGTLLRHAAAGDEIHWLIVTRMEEAAGFSRQDMLRRDQELKQVAAAYGFTSVEHLNLSTTRLDTLPLADLVSAIGGIIRKTAPETLYLPHGGDVHSDHGQVFKAVESCSKWFRFPSLMTVASFETISETDQAFGLEFGHFVPNQFVDISRFLERKIEIMMLYATEIGEFPFPRSAEAIRALARYRGATAGYEAAEAFMLLRGRR